MGATSNLLNMTGLVLLAHAVYSAHEHSLLAIPTATPVSRSTISTYLSPNLTLPTDIVLETLISVLLLCVGVVLSSPALKPIEWRVWAGLLERSTEAREAARLVDGVGNGPRGNPYRVLEERQGFLDIRARRKEFGEWVREGGGL